MIEWQAPGGGMWQLETTHVRGAQPRVFQERAIRGFGDGFAGPARRTGCRSTASRCASSTTTATAGWSPSAHPSRSRARRAGHRPASSSGCSPDSTPSCVDERRRRNAPSPRSRGSRTAAGGRPSSDRRCSPPTGPCRPTTSPALDDDALVDHLAPGRRPLPARHDAALRPHARPRHPRRPLRRGLLRRGVSRPATCSRSSPAPRRPRLQSAAGLAAIAAACADAGVDPHTLDDVRAASPAAAPALDVYLADHGWRVVSQYSPRALALIELPDVLVRGDPRPPRPAAAATPPDSGAVRDRVPADRSRLASTSSSPTPAPPTSSATTTSRSPSCGQRASCAGRCSKPGRRLAERGAARRALARHGPR